MSTRHCRFGKIFGLGICRQVFNGTTQFVLIWLTMGKTVRLRGFYRVYRIGRRYLNGLRRESGYTSVVFEVGSHCAGTIRN